MWHMKLALLKLSGYLYFLLPALLISCSTGKYALLNGDYEAAVYRAVDYLEKHPNDQRSMAILAEAYSTFLSHRLSAIVKLEQENAPFSHELILTEYVWLHRVSGYVLQCQACAKYVNARDYTHEIDRQRTLAFDERMQYGQESLEQARLGNKIEARKAIGHLAKAGEIKHGSSAQQNLLSEAVELSKITVAIQVFDTAMGLPRNYLFDLENHIIASTANKARDTLIRFVSFNKTEALNCFADWEVEVEVTDVFNNDIVKTRQVFKRIVDNVVVGHTKPKGKDSLGNRLEPEPTYGTVKATVRQTHVSTSTLALATMAIYDKSADENLYYEQLKATESWNIYKYSFKGDERALSDNDRRNLQTHETIPSLKKRERKTMIGLGELVSSHISFFISSQLP